MVSKVIISKHAQQQLDDLQAPSAKVFFVKNVHPGQILQISLESSQQGALRRAR